MGKTRCRATEIAAAAFGVLVFATTLMPVSASAEVETNLRPLIYDTDTPELLYLVGDIDIRTPVLFSQALAQHPEVATLVLSSRGGSVHAALSMAYAVRAAGLKTHIPADGQCLSACAYLFFAGVERSAEGPLGVHQLSSGSDSLAAGQVALADIVAAYTAFGVPNDVLSRMLVTPAEGMYLFKPEEMAVLGMLGGDMGQPGPVPTKRAWTAKFSLDLANGTSVEQLIGTTCGQFSTKRVNCNMGSYGTAIWGIVAQPDGTRSISAWSAVNVFNGYPLSAGEEIDVANSEITYRPFGLLDTKEGPLLFGATNATRITDTEGFTKVTGIKAEASPFLIDVQNPNDFLFNNQIYDMGYSEVLDLYTSSNFGMLTFWRVNPEISSENNIPRRSLVAYCKLTADGAVPWNRVDFSDDGRILAAAHGGWTAIARLPSESELGEAIGSVGPGQYDHPVSACKNIEVDYFTHLPFEDLSPSGGLVAILHWDTDPSDAEGRGQNRQRVLAVYETRRLIESWGIDAFSPISAKPPAPSFVTEFRGFLGLLSSAAFSEAETEILALTEAGVLKVWSIPDGKLIHALPDLDGAPIEAAQFVGDTGCLVVSAKGRNSVFLDPFTGQVVQEFPTPSGKFMLDEANELLFTYSFGERPIRAYESTGYTCRN